MAGFESKEELIKAFREFEKASYDKYKPLYNQIREDRKFIAGKQNDDLDKTLLSEDIPNCGMNVTQNAIRTIVNTYLPEQFKFHYIDINEQYAGSAQLNPRADVFLTDPDNSTGAVEALTNAVGTALGVIVFSTDYDVDGSVKPVMYSVPDVTNVRLDPSATKLNFADATKAAIVELKSKEWLREQYGEEIVGSTNEYERPLIDISEDYDRKNYLPLVTFYVKEENFAGVTCYKLLGSSLVEDPITLPFSYIPVIPVFGEATWTSEDKQSWSGITTNVRPIQKLINYSYRQLLLRCARAPKNTWLGSVEAVGNNAKYYKNSDKGLNPFLSYNAYDAKGRKLDPPTRIPNNIEFQDIDQLMQNALGLMNSIIGIPSTGLETDVEKTATEVLVNDKIFNNNVRNYLYHLKSTLQMVGVLFADYNYNEPMYGKIKVVMIAGPDDAMKKQEARVQFQQYAPLVTSDTDKQKLLIAMCQVESDNEYIQNFLKLLTPAQTPMEMQQAELLTQADGEIKKRDAQIAQLQNQIHELEQEQKISAYSFDREMLKDKQQHNYKMEEILLQAKLKGDDPEVERIKGQAEIDKAEMSVQKEAIGLQKEIVKASQPVNKEEEV